MEVDKKEQLRQMLSGFAGDGLLPLDEAAKLLKVSEGYLLGLIRRGKLKAFKVDEHWFVQMKWLEQFREDVRKHISEALPASSASKWVKPIKRKKSGFMPFALASFEVAVVSLLLAVILPVFSVLASPARLAEKGLDMMAYGALSVSDFYRRPVSSVAAAISSKKKINDEQITRWSRQLLGAIVPVSGTVAGASEIRK